MKFQSVYYLELRQNFNRLKFVFKELGVTHVLAATACGSLQVIHFLTRLGYEKIDEFIFLSILLVIFIIGRSWERLIYLLSFLFNSSDWGGGGVKDICILALPFKM